MASHPKTRSSASTRTGASKRGPRAAPRPASPGRGTNGANGTATAEARATIRFYCQGIGDCHLLKFPKDGGGDFWMLIDCGIHSSIPGGTQKIKDIVDNIASITKRLDVIVLTHEHWDHNSGFLLAQDKFKGFDVGEIWMGWTEDPDDPQARQLDKFKGAAIDSLQQASQRLAGVRQLGAHLSTVQNGLQSVLGFNFGAKGERVRSARDAAVNLAKKTDRKYLEPKSQPFSPPALAKSVRIYVLGPPRDAAMLGLTERQSEMYGLAAAGGWPIARALGNALSEDPAQLDNDLTAPFDSVEGNDLSVVRSAHARSSTDEKLRNVATFIRDFYDGPAELAMGAKQPSKPGKPVDPNKTDQSWRRIDHDWLAVSSDLAIQLDDRTNNSSLVLAFEFLDTRRVMLFVGDAQVGNWLSWQKVSWASETTTVADLLARTVFYKVGHHGSHNATLRQHGLELMTHRDLSAFIPTNANDAQRVKWGQMPFGPILDDLKKRTGGRTIRADDPWLTQPAGNPEFSTPGAIVGLRHDSSGLWVELDLA